MKPILKAVHQPQAPEMHSVVQSYVPVATDRERTDLRVADLSKGAQLAIWSIRKWVQSRRRKQPSEALAYRTAYRMAGIPEAAEVLDELMLLLATTTLRPVLIECACCRQLSTDEVLILRSLRSLQLGNIETARQRMSRLLSGRLSNAFCRSAAAYVDSLERAGLSLQQITQIGLVESSE